jgi:DNA-directed RNA polymerase subunit RPC12/RpoP
MVDHTVFGRFNDYPPNWEPCDEHEFWFTFMNNAPVETEYRQMLRRNENRQVESAMLYFYSDGSGIAFVENVKNSQHYTPKLYKFAKCIHDYEELPQRFNAYHEYKCKKCGHEYSIDSGD